MILAASSGWTGIAINVLLVVHVAVALLLCLVVMMQRPKQEGLGAAFGGGMTDQAFGARTTDVLQKTTVFLGSLFFIIALLITVLVSSEKRSKSLDATLKQNGEAQLEESAAVVNDALKEAGAAEAVEEAPVPAEAPQPAPEAVPAPAAETAPASPTPAAPVPEQSAAPQG